MVTRSNAAAAAGAGDPAPASALRTTPSGKFGNVSFLTLLRAQCRVAARDTRDALRPRSILAHLKRHLVGYGLFLVGVALLIALCGTAWKGLGADAYYVLAVLYLACSAMVSDIADPDVCLFFACLMYMLKGLITPRDTFAGLSNDSIITIALMIGIASGIEATGALDYLSHYMLTAGMSQPAAGSGSGSGGAGKKRPDSAAGEAASAEQIAEDGAARPASAAAAAKQRWYRSPFVQRNVAKVRMFSIVAFISAWINNTPLVALLIPVMERFCRRFRQPTSQYMMPLSYAAIVGG
jgi:hypothetical protein